MKNLEAADEVDQCICRLVFLSDAIDLDLSEKAESGLSFILDDIISHLEKASKLEKATDNGKEKKASEQPGKEDTDAPSEQ